MLRRINSTSLHVQGTCFIVPPNTDSQQEFVDPAFKVPFKRFLYHFRKPVGQNQGTQFQYVPETHWP